MLTPQMFERQIDLEDDADEAVRIWHHRMNGSEIEQIREHVDLRPTQITRILTSAPPTRIRMDLRYQTGQRAVRLTQSGKDALLGPDGLPRPLVAFLPHRISLPAYHLGIAAIEAEIKDEDSPDVVVNSAIAPDLDMRDALSMIADGTPAWEIDTKGNLKRYNGRHARMLRLIDWRIKAHIYEMRPAPEMAA
jgi:hypothetical protein